METERGDVVASLAIVAVPGDRGVAEADARGRRVAASPHDRSRGGTQTREKIAALHRVSVLRRRHRATRTITNKSRRRAPNSEVRDMISGRSVALDPTGMYHQER